jgi:hypothetical protein
MPCLASVPVLHERLIQIKMPSAEIAVMLLRFPHCRDPGTVDTVQSLESAFSFQIRSPAPALLIPELIRIRATVFAILRTELIRVSLAIFARNRADLLRVSRSPLALVLALPLLAGDIVRARVGHVSLPSRLATPRDGDSRRRGLLMEKPRSGLALGAAGLVQVADQRVELVSRQQRNLPRPYVEDFREERLVAAGVVGVPSGAAGLTAPCVGFASASAAFCRSTATSRIDCSSSR